MIDDWFLLWLLGNVVWIIGMVIESSGLWGLGLGILIGSCLMNILDSKRELRDIKESSTGGNK